MYSTKRQTICKADFVAFNFGMILTITTDENASFSPEAPVSINKQIYGKSPADGIIDLKFREYYQGTSNNPRRTSSAHHQLLETPPINYLHTLASKFFL
ncbi:MAG: hypothetical protein LBR98_06620 [Syntrophomonadaceae bacterium]|nr:hypothetical protein [Syntrophomonadaceae bacterium]